MIGSAIIPQIDEIARRFSDASAGTILDWAEETFGTRVALATSLSVEDQALTDLMANRWPGFNCFTLDTGRLFPETYELIQRTEERYGMRIRILTPDSVEVEQLVNEFGINAFRESVELRRRCCHIRKVRPLTRALEGMDAWISGLRRDPTITRRRLAVVEWDDANNLVKVNPLANWDHEQVMSYVRKYQVPYNPLHDQGFLSIGCACCTRPVESGEDERAGRWWWETLPCKEDGLHR